MGRLERLFAAVVPTLVVGCEKGIDESQFTDDVCGEGEVHMLQAIEPEQAIDSVEWRRASVLEFDENGDPVIERTDIVDADGQHCRGASDEAACLADVAAVPVISNLVEGSFEYTYYDSLLYTRADEVGALLELDAVRTFLGTI
ncbi:MAG TPA: hypothetical protein VG755_15470, partial [Nannocystaceae bacterium]|nr:hypothetical protein [Nannocystaceae bacterium]